MLIPPLLVGTDAGGSLRRDMRHGTQDETVLTYDGIVTTCSEQHNHVETTIAFQNNHVETTIVFQGGIPISNSWQET